MQEIIGRFLKHWPLLLILVLTFVLRIYKLEELFYFTYDESIPAFVARRLILWHHVPLIGAVTPFNFHLAPYFYWFLAFILWLGKLNPISWGYTSALLAMLTTMLIALVGKSFFNKRVGITSAILWAFSYLANVYDRHLWALYWGPLVSLLVLFSIYKITKGKEKFIYLLGIVIALSIHADPSNLVFLFLAIIVWIIYKLPFKKSTLIAASFIVISFLPLVVFDLRHNFANTKPVLNFFNQGRNTPSFSQQRFIYNSLIFPQAFTRLIYTFGDNQIAKQYSYCRNYVLEKYQKIPRHLILLSSLTLISFLFWSFKKSPKTTPYRLISLLVSAYYLGILFYGTIFKADIFEHYITGLFAVFLLIFAKIVSLFPKKVWLIIMAIFVFANLYKLSLAKNSHGLKYKREAIEYTMQQVGDKPFSLDSLSTCWKYSGYRYLFAVFGREPVKSYVDPNFGHLYGSTPIAKNHPQTVVTFVIHDFANETVNYYKRYAVFKSHETAHRTFGNIEVIIIDNSSGWFNKQ